MSEEIKSIGVLGGAFDPPHLGHVSLVLTALASSPYDEIWVMPAGDHPEKQNITPFQQRYEMCLLAFRHLKNVKISDFEQSLEGRTYTYHVVSALMTSFPEAAFTWLTGSDNRDKIKDWYRGEELLELISFDTSYHRGHQYADKGWFIPDISSSQIREDLTKKMPHQKINNIIDEAVFRYIEQYRLYKE